MGLGGVMLAVSAVQGITAIGQGNAKSAEDKYNATLSTLQAQQAQVQGDITQGQYVRKAGQLLSTQTATAGAAGIEPTGSIAAVMLDSQTQINTDMAIAKYNTQMNINYANNAASMQKRQAAMDVNSGYSNAFSDILTGTTNYAMYKYGGKNALNLSGGAGQV